MLSNYFYFKALFIFGCLRRVLPRAKFSGKYVTRLPETDTTKLKNCHFSRIVMHVFISNNAEFPHHLMNVSRGTGSETPHSSFHLLLPAQQLIPISEIGISIATSWGTQRPWTKRGMLNNILKNVITVLTTVVEMFIGSDAWEKIWNKESLGWKNLFAFFRVVVKVYSVSLLSHC